MRKAVRAALSTARTARTPGPLARYGQLVTKGRLRRDAAQVAVLEHDLERDRLRKHLEQRGLRYVDIDAVAGLYDVGGPRRHFCGR